MERLTEKDEQGNWCLKGVPWERLHEGQVITKSLRERLYGALCKLMEYEDTDLTPEEIEQLKDKVTISKMENVQADDWIPVEERLPKLGEGNWCLKGVPWERLHEGQVITKSLRERLYGALCKLMEYEDTGLTPEGAEGFNDFEKTQAAYWLKRLDEEQDKHRWIPAEERLPEKDDTVLVTIEGTCGKVLTVKGIELGYYEKTWFICSNIKLKKIRVTAWKPLPEPYHPPAVED